MPDSVQNKKQPQVTFVDLISLIAGVVGCACVVATARNAGMLDIIASWIVGLLIGFGSLWGTRVAMKRAIFSLKINRPKLSPTRLIMSWALCLAVIAWIIISGFIAAYLTRSIIAYLK
jgi:hypothetical protein